jgi:type I restriction enzyme S subunit
MSEQKRFKRAEIGKLPIEWRIVGLSEVFSDIKNGFASGKRDNDGIVQIRMNNVTTDGHLIFDSFVKVPVPENINEFLLRENDLLFNNTNSIDLVGKSTIFKDVSFPCTFSNHFTRIRFADGVLPEWVLFHFIRLWRKGFFRSVAIRHVGQSAVHTKYLTNINLPLPPLPEQKKIAEILSTVDQAIEKVDEAIEKTQRLKKGLMQELLTKGIGHKEFKETEIGRIPKEWEVMKLGELVDIRSGLYFKYSEFKNDGVRCLKIDNVGFGEILWDTVTYLREDYIKKFPDIVLEEGDVVMALNRPIINGDLKIGILGNKDSPSILYQRVGKMIIKNENIKSLYLFYLSSSEVFKKMLLKTLVGTDQPYIRTPMLLSLKISLPQPLEQQKVAEILSTVDKRLDLLKNKKERLGKIKKGLMNDLLAGRKRVKSYTA